MWQCKATNPETKRTCNRMNPDSAAKCAECGAPKPVAVSQPPVKFMWALIMGVVVLVICMAIPAVFSLGASIRVMAAKEGVEQRDMAGPEDAFLPGASHESRNSTLSTTYRATLVPSRLDNPVPYTLIHVMYGPVFMTGSTLELGADASTISQGNECTIRYRLVNLATPVLFYVGILLLLLLVNIFTRNPRSVLNYVIGITLVWAVWALVLMIFGHVLTRPISDLVNLVLVEQHGHGNYEPIMMRVFDPVARVFITGMFYWVIATMLIRARTETTDHTSPAM